MDRSKPLRFTFNGEALTGYAGDTLASALLANGRILLGRSFKYHRPRGVLSHGSEEPNALVTLRAEGGRVDPNTRATMVELRDGLVAESQNHWPSLEFDLGAMADVLAPIIPAGFYYKTFMWPASFWKKLYEPAIRAAAGLGRAPQLPDPDRYHHRHAHCDVLIAGGGRAGLEAALAASVSGKRVIAADENAQWGGRSLPQEVDALVVELKKRPNVTLLLRTTVFGIFGHNHVGMLQHMDGVPRQRLWQVRAGEIVSAAGAHERPLVFAGNDRPGILLADSARQYALKYGVAPGRQVVVATCGDSAYGAAREMLKAGVKVTTLIDVRPDPHVALVRDLQGLGVEVLTGQTIVGTKGRKRISAVRVSRRTIACDALAMHGGWTPAVHLYSQARGKLRFDEAIDAFVPGSEVPGFRSTGAARGERLTRFAPIRQPSGQGFVDFQNDVTAKDIALALREGFESIEHVKRYTTTGMATDQGKTSNMSVLGIVADTLKRPVPQVGTTTFRMPYTPVTFGALIGAHRGALFDVVRETPSHAWASARGALLEDVGQWKRALAFPQAGEDLHAAVRRECRIVRATGGLFDASTLGKIEVVGRDAREFLNRMYVNDFSRLAPGRSRYALMLREDGYVYDDGIVACLAPERFHVTTTTGGAARVLAYMEDYLQTEWNDLQVYLTSITEQYAVIAVQGPKAELLVPEMKNLSHMGVSIGTFDGIPCRLFRASFTGEVGCEINVPWGEGPALWEKLCDRGAALGFTVYGTETMHVLRAERGFIIVGQETDGTVTPHDLGLESMIGAAGRDFVGRRSLARPDLRAANRKQLVGLLTEDPRLVLEEGAQLVADPREQIPMTALGHVSSSYDSANCGRSIAMALVAGGRARLGETLYATTADGFAPAKVAKLPFLHG
ncbi:MAG TPA: 2Fe-2S iron-sulfur cluster-binding protein [Burkholderiales bacterium]|nr:2Fe-2S iron-sulfur cluster-binding protein [Burkholderiales bacterium]